MFVGDIIDNKNLVETMGLYPTYPAITQPYTYHALPESQSAVSPTSQIPWVFPNI